jgi:hypothetical protein
VWYDEPYDDADDFVTAADEDDEYQECFTLDDLEAQCVVDPVDGSTYATTRSYP